MESRFRNNRQLLLRKGVRMELRVTTDIYDYYKSMRVTRLNQQEG